MLQFLWGLTPAVRDLTGRDILPTYNYFRPYRKNDICRVHSDREACEHSLSLTLGYSDGQIWPFDVGQDPIDRLGDIVDDFTGKPSLQSPCSLAMRCSIAGFNTGTAASNRIPTAGLRTSS